MQLYVTYPTVGLKYKIFIFLPKIFLCWRNFFFSWYNVLQYLIIKCVDLLLASYLHVSNIYWYFMLTGLLSNVESSIPDPCSLLHSGNTTPPISPTRILRESDNQWLNSEVSLYINLHIVQNHKSCIIFSGGWLLFE
jgi:hypothetical protein